MGVTRPVTHRPQLAMSITIHPRPSSTLTPTRRSFKAAISNINGIGGKAAWAWIFISEGFATVVAGVLSFWIIVDFPDDATSLSTRSSSGDFRENDQFSAAGERPKWENIVASLTKWKTYLYSTKRLVIVYSGSNMPLYAFALFLPSIISKVRFSFSSLVLLSFFLSLGIY